MTHAERKEMREKHYLWKDKDCNYDGESYPCDVIKVLDYLDVVDPMPTEINWQGGK